MGICKQFFSPKNIIEIYPEHGKIWQHGVRESECIVLLQTGKPVRFDFHGNLVVDDKDIPAHLGLHHHGAEPEVSSARMHHINLQMVYRKSNIRTSR